MHYESEITVRSKIADDVSYRICRMSFGRRLALTEKIRGLVDRGQFLEAGAGSPSDSAEAAILRANVDREYLRWGLFGVDGLSIDGQPADAETLLAKGPEELVIEAVNAVRRETGLTGDERKNSSSHSISTSDPKPDGTARTAEGTVWNKNADAAGSNGTDEERPMDAPSGSAGLRATAEDG